MRNLVDVIGENRCAVRSVGLTVALIALSSWTSVLSGSENLGPDWDEDSNGGGDAGDKPSTAQKVEIDTTTSLTKISGKLKGEDSSGSLAGDPDEGDFQDVYEVVIKQAGEFQIETLPPNGNTEFNSVLCVYDYNGIAKLANIDADQGTQGSRVGNISTNGKFTIDEPGAIFISISGNGSFPLSTEGNPIFSFTENPTEVVGPTADGQQLPLEKWTGPGPVGSYVIALTAVGPFPPECGAENTQSCGVAHPLPYCSDTECCTAVCAVDPLCCEVRWDFSCVSKAQLLCNNGEGGCGTAETESCFELHKSPYCNDTVCCAKVCAINHACCSLSWDSNCVSLAYELCTQPCNLDCPADLNYDGIVNGADLTLLLGEWGSGGCGDINESGQVDGADLALLLGQWGFCRK